MEGVPGLRLPLRWAACHRLQRGIDPEVKKNLPRTRAASCGMAQGTGMIDTSAGNGTASIELLPARPLAFVEPVCPQVLLEILEGRLWRQARVPLWGQANTLLVRPQGVAVALLPKHGRVAGTCTVSNEPAAEGVRGIIRSLDGFHARHIAEVRREP